MKAIIMAGGEGSRLRPLTCDCPKPMVPVLDRPVMEYALELLKRHSVKEVGVTLQYLPDRIQDHFGDGSEFSVDMKYYVERTPLGTAGSVRQAIEFLDETFVVLSGDGLTDCDLSEALRFHRAKGALATMVLKRVESPLEYGVVITDADGRVRRFVEKPGWGEVFSDTVNTGIYILEPEVLKSIPEGRAFDFGRELFPQLVNRDKPVYAYVMEGYWCDIGDTSAYLRAHIDAMDGRIQLPMPVRPGGVCRMQGAQVDRGAVLEGPCFIGSGARIEEGARVGAYSVIGAGAVVQPQASIKRAVLWQGAQVLERGQVRGGVLCRGAVLGRDAAAFEESVLGDCVRLGDRCTLLPGVRIWPHKRVDEGVRVDQNLVWGARSAPRFEGGALALESPQQAAQVVQAYCAAMKPREVVLGRAASPVAQALALSVSAGLMAQGVQVLDSGISTLPQLRSTMWSLGARGALLVGEQGLTLLAESGAALTREQERKVEGMLIRQEFEAAFSGPTHKPVPLGRTDLTYMGMLLGSVDRERFLSDPPKLAVYAPGEQMLSLAERVLERAGCAVRAEWEEEMMELAPGEIGLWLDDTGETLRLADSEGMLEDGQQQQLMAFLALEKGVKRLIVPMGTTHAVRRLAERYEASVEYVKSDRVSCMLSCLKAGEEGMLQFLIRYDALYAALAVLEHLTASQLPLRQLLLGMQTLYRRVRSVPVDWRDKGRVLRALSELEPGADLMDGLSVENDRGWAWVSPSSDRAECLVVSESVDMEAAKELCDLFAGRIQTIVNQGKSQPTLPN